MRAERPRVQVTTGNIFFTNVYNTALHFVWITVKIKHRIPTLSGIFKPIKYLIEILYDFKILLKRRIFSALLYSHRSIKYLRTIICDTFNEFEFEYLLRVKSFFGKINSDRVILLNIIHRKQCIDFVINYFAKCDRLMNIRS